MDSVKPRVMINEVILNHWKKIKSNIPKNKEHMDYFDHDIPCLGKKDTFMTGTQFILFDGNGFGLGEDTKDGKLKIFLVGYPCVEELTNEQNSLILDNIGKEITDGYEITIGDSFLQFGKMKELLYTEQ